MAKRAPLTTQEERLQRLIRNAENKIVELKGLVDTDRRVVAAQHVKVEDPDSPQIIRVSEGGNLALGNEGNWRVIGGITQPASHTGDLIETELGAILLPPNSMGPNGVVRVWSVWEGFPTSSGHHHFIYFGQKLLANRIAYWANATASTVRAIPTEVWNANAADHQVHFGSGHNISMVLHNIPNVAPTELAEDTTLEVPIYFTGKVDNAAHTVTLHYALVEAVYRS